MGISSQALRGSRARRPRTHTIQGVEFVGRRSRWETSDDYSVERYEGDYGGWQMWGADPHRALWFGSLQSAAWEIARLRELAGVYSDSKK